MQKVYPASIPSFGRPLHIQPQHRSLPSYNDNNSNSSNNNISASLAGFELFPQWGLPLRPEPQLYHFFNNRQLLVQQQQQQQPQQSSSLVIDNSGSHKKQKTHNEPVQDKDSPLANILNPTIDNSLPSFSQFELRRPQPQQQPQQSSQQQQQPSPSHTPSLPIMIIKDGSSNSRSILNSSVTDSFSPCSSMPSSPIDHQLSGSPGSNMSNKQIMSQWMQELVTLNKRKEFILENIKQFASDDSDDQTPSQSPSERYTPPAIIAINQQPPDVVICHRYIQPSLTLAVDREILARTVGTLSVHVSLIYSTTGKPVTPKQGDDKQEVLQGILSQEVDRNGVVSFSKLKVSEVSSKHLHQSFSLTFTLTETMLDGKSHVITQVISSAFHVFSRSNKRKKEDDQSAIDSDPKEPSSPSHSKSSPGTYSSPSSPSSPFQSQFLPGAVVVASSNDDQTHSMVPTTSGPSTTTDHNNYIDITELLVLPQKEAATKLGISESMLCKRFKECTRRKWPYRYLRKIDKVINILSFQNGSEIPKEDREKLDKLMQEREECLRPVKIRITGCLGKDDDSSPTGWFKHSVATVKTSSSSNQLVPQTPQNKCAIRLLNEESEDTVLSTGTDAKMHLVVQPTSLPLTASKGEAGSLEFNILETLEMLKHTRQ